MPLPMIKIYALEKMYSLHTQTLQPQHLQASQIYFAIRGGSNILYPYFSGSGPRAACGSPSDSVHTPPEKTHSPHHIHTQHPTPHHPRSHTTKPHTPPYKTPYSLHPSPHTPHLTITSSTPQNHIPHRTPTQTSPPQTPPATSPPRHRLLRSAPCKTSSPHLLKPSPPLPLRSRLHRNSTPLQESTNPRLHLSDKAP